MKIIDLSQTIVHDMPVYPGDPRTVLKQISFFDEDGHNNHQLQIGMHTGTHIDAPMHMTTRQEYISECCLTCFMGQGCILDVRNQPVVRVQQGYREQIPEHSILLLWTGQDRLYGSESYFTDYPVIDPEFCDLMMAKKIKMLGLDSPSPDNYPFPIHKALLDKGIFILENLTNLSRLQGVTDFEVIALPLKIRADGAMTRAVARLGHH